MLRRSIFELQQVSIQVNREFARCQPAVGLEGRPERIAAIAATIMAGERPRAPCRPPARNGRSRSRRSGNVVTSANPNSPRVLAGLPNARGR